MLKRKIAGLVALLMGVVAIVVIAPTSPAVADPAVGIHEAVRECSGVNGSNTAWDGKITVRWQVELIRHKPAPGERNEYLFTLLSASYLGDVYQQYYPSLSVDVNGGPGSVKVTAQNGSNPVGVQRGVFGTTPSAIGPFTVRTRTSVPPTEPVWAPFQINMSAGGTFTENRMEVNFGNATGINNCVKYIDLSLPGSPNVSDPNNMTPSTGKFPDCVRDGSVPGRAGANAELVYRLEDEGQGDYSLVDMDFTIQGEYLNNPGEEWFDEHTLTLYTRGIATDITPDGGMHVAYDDVHGASPPYTVSWPDEGSHIFAPQDQTFGWSDGDSPPYVEWTAVNSLDVTDTCIQRWYLTTEWDNTGLDPDLNYQTTAQYAFDDCNGGQGYVELSAMWHLDFNEQKIQVSDFVIRNLSNSRIVLSQYLNPGGSGNAAKSPQIRSMAPNQVYSSSGLSSDHALRYILGMSNRGWDITTGNNWRLVYSPTFFAGPIYAAPGRSTYPDAADMSFFVTAIAQNPDGATGWTECLAARPGLSNMELSSSQGVS